MNQGLYWKTLCKVEMYSRQANHLIFNTHFPTTLHNDLLYIKKLM